MATKATHALALPGVAGGATFYHDVIAPMTQHLPVSPLARGGYADPPGRPIVFDSWSGGEGGLWAYLRGRPELLGAFQQLMALDRGGGDWVGCVDFDEEGGVEEGKEEGERVVFVDVGGNVGHQARRLVERHPRLAGRVVVEDLPETVGAAAAAKGVRFLAHDFFNPQPVKGARYYYLRSVLHNWGGAKAVEILKNLAAVLAEDSRVLIDETVVPDQGADLWVAGQDLNMMLLLGAMERRKDDWIALLDRAGLKIVDIKTYGPVTKNSIIVAMLK